MRMTAALGSEATLARLLNDVATPHNGRHQRRQFEPVAALIDALNRRGTPLTKLNETGGKPMRTAVIVSSPPPSCWISGMSGGVEAEPSSSTAGTRTPAPVRAGSPMRRKRQPWSVGIWASLCTLSSSDRPA